MKVEVTGDISTIPTLGLSKSVSMTTVKIKPKGNYKFEDVRLEISPNYGEGWISDDEPYDSRILNENGKFEKTYVFTKLHGIQIPTSRDIKKTVDITIKNGLVRRK